jgi:hypothetical protein
VLTACAWAKHGDRIPIAAALTALWRSLPTGFRPGAMGAREAGILRRSRRRRAVAVGHRLEYAACDLCAKLDPVLEEKSVR